MTLMAANIRQKFKLTPNSKIVEPYNTVNNNMGMEDSMNNSNLWDSIQVDMSAEFDKVKVPLGELKSIEEGLIVDLCSVYDNKVSLKVGGKLVASGELVIINDRFGVRIERVSEANPADNYNEHSEPENTAEEKGEDFDYSDFEVEEEK
jgi:flagellar motor switch/type III secretory pathway protein FliN